jgi:MATE family multidrug resistance protein
MQPSDKALWRLAFPLVLANATEPLLGMVDTAVIGRLAETEPLAAVVLGTQLFNILFWAFGFLRMGTTAFAAQAFGLRDTAAIRAIFVQTSILGGIIGLLLLLLFYPMGVLSFFLLKPSANIETLAWDYYTVRILAAPGALINFALYGWLIGMQRSVLALWVAIVINLVNIPLSVLFVLVFSLGVKGVALAAVIAEYVGLMAAFGAVWVVLRRYPGAFPFERIFQLSAYRPLLMVNRDIFFRTFLLIIVMGWFTRASAAFGDIVLAANGILLIFYTFMAYTIDGFAQAIESITGHVAGINDQNVFKKSLVVFTRWGIILCLFFCALYHWMGPWFTTFLTANHTIQSAVLDYLPWLYLLPFVSVAAFFLDGIYIGILKVKTMRNSMALACFTFAVIYYTLPSWQNHGLWFAFTGFLAARAGTLGFNLYRMLKHPFTLFDKTA